jgi:hypothetical protein
MILKDTNDLRPLVRQLDELLSRTLTERQQQAIKGRELTLRVTARPGSGVAYLIDLQLKAPSKWVVIHDLRVEPGRETRNDGRSKPHFATAEG